MAQIFLKQVTYPVSELSPGVTQAMKQMRSIYMIQKVLNEFIISLLLILLVLQFDNEIKL
jgi:cytochrome c oxidase assembly factor CtaG